VSADERHVLPVHCGVDKDGTTLKVTSVDRTTSSTLTYRQSPADRLVLDGTLDGRLVHLELKQVDLNTFLLNGRGFHWIQEVPFNRLRRHKGFGLQRSRRSATKITKSTKAHFVFFVSCVAKTWCPSRQ
jgi:hypothetical protein